MQTIWMLMAMYEGAPIVSVERVRNDFFGGMARRSFLEKVESGEIPCRSFASERRRRPRRGSISTISPPTSTPARRLRDMN